jgi:hypothetical protein
MYCITFRIHQDAGAPQRYASTIEAIKSVCHGEYWDEPTSFFLFENPSTSAAIANYVNKNSSFDPSKDILLVTNLSLKQYAPLGKIKNPQLLARLMAKR